MPENRPNIAIVHYSGPPTVGGVQNVMAAQARAFAEAGYAVKVVVGRGGHFHQGIEVKIIPAMDPKHLDVSALLERLERGGSDQGFEALQTRLAEELSETLSSSNICIVHNVFTMDKNIVLTAALCRVSEMLKGVRFVAWTHDAVFLREEFNDRHSVDTPPWSSLRHPVPGLSYVTVSEARAHELMERWGEENISITTIPNGVCPPDLLGIAPADYAVLESLGLLESFPVILIPVRVLERKNISLALRVVHALANMGREPLLIVTGPPGTHSLDHEDYFRVLKEEAGRLKIEKHIKFLCEYKDLQDPSQPLSVTDELVAALYKLSDILFMPSTEEGFGLPLLEAGIHKLPVLCSDLGPFREIGGGNMEFFTLDLPPEEVAGKVLALTEGSKTGRMFRSVIREYRWEKIFQERIEPLILKLWEERRRAHG